IIVLSSDSLDDNKGVSSKGPSTASVPKEGPSTASVCKDESSIPRETFFDSTDKDITDKDSTNEDTIDESLSSKSKGKNVPVAKKPSPKVIFKSLISIKGCVLGLANYETWNNIMKKFGMRTPGSCGDKSKGKRKVFS
nr:hypothetical protein [Tanacetum cinerariifolium]